MNNCSKQHPLLCLIYANTVLEQHRWPWPVAWCIIHRKLQHLQPQAQTWPSTDFQDQAHWVLKKQNLKMTKTGYQWCLLSHDVQGGLHKWEVLQKYFSDVFPHRRALRSSTITLLELAFEFKSLYHSFPICVCTTLSSNRNKLIW